MPTTLPVRSRDSDFGQKRGLPRSSAVILLWAMMMFAVTAVSPASNATVFTNVDGVMP